MTIPANQIVNVNPGVVGGGGNPLSLNGVILSENVLLPSGQVQSFTSADAVSAFFGPASEEYALAQIYFSGYENSTMKPGILFFAPYAGAATSAWVKGGSLAGQSLAQLQALSGSLSIVMDGYTHASAGINLSTASSPSDAATKIQTALDLSEPTESVVTGTIAGTTMTVTAVTSGTLDPGQTVTGSTVTTQSVILSQLTSTEVDGTLGGKGTYQLSESSTVGTGETLTASASPVTVAWDAIHSAFTVTSQIAGTISTSAYATGTLAAGLMLTSATGATLSQGIAGQTPASAMNAIKAITQNWCSFMTLWEPVIADKEGFAIWANAQNQRYLYVAWDTDAQAIVNGSTTCFGVVANAAEYNGVTCLSGDPAAATAAGTTLAAILPELAAFVMGMIASINYAEMNGRITTAFKSQSGFTPTCTNEQTGANLLANGYSFYGAYATANEEFNFLYNGQMPGEWQWIDTFVNQVYLNAQFQLALLTFMTAIGAIPYNQYGYSLVRAAMMDPINSGLNSGIIRAGVVLSSGQAALVDNAAGKAVSGTLQNQGYYLQILDPGAQARANRQTPIINFFYTDGGAVQQINLASIDVM
jgi:hypothetical protein